MLSFRMTTRKSVFCVRTLLAMLMAFVIASYFVTSWIKPSLLSSVSLMPWDEVQRRYFQQKNPDLKDVILPDVSSCSDVLSGMTSGTWQQHQMTLAERQEIKAFYKRAHAQHQIPEGLQRPDKKCGNVSIATHFRALCDAEGTTPCCYNNQCVNMTRAQCACASCLDMRSRIHAEHATWRPTKVQCQLKHLTVYQICHLLQNSTIHFIGDSLMRHIYTAFLLAVTGNELTGAQSVKTPDSIRTVCSGLDMFTEKICRAWVNRSVTVCNRTSRLQLSTFYQLQYAKDVVRAVQELYNKSRSLVFIGLGVHDGLQANRIIVRLMLPLLKQLTELKVIWPKLLWAGVHQWGLLKFDSLYPDQAWGRVVQFNKKMKNFLSQWHVPFFDTFNLTGSVISFDGTHFGMGANKVKAQILLNYLLELQSTGQW